jgi:hypothetical protein
MWESAISWTPFASRMDGSQGFWAWLLGDPLEVNDRERDTREATDGVWLVCHYGYIHF